MSRLRQEMELHTLGRIVESMGATMMDLYLAQQSAGDHGARIENGTLPPDTRTQPPATPHKAAVRLAQECGKAVAHCCLAFLELQSDGWGDADANGAASREGWLAPERNSWMRHEGAICLDLMLLALPSA